MKLVQMHDRGARPLRSTAAARISAYTPQRVQPSEEVFQRHANLAFHTWKHKRVQLGISYLVVILVYS